jgi:hypothetical protein
MRGHLALTIVLTTWTLLYSRWGGEWLPLDDFVSHTACTQVRQAWIAREAQHDIGSVLANQPADNPLRQRAMAKALPRVESRFRCESR